MSTKKFVAKHGLDNNNQTISNVATPVDGNDAANKTFASDASNLTAGTLPSARLPAFSGDVSSSQGSTTLTLGATGVTAGTYNNTATTVTPITVDTKGRITGTGPAVTITPAFSSVTGKPTSLAGYGITDAAPSSHVGATGAAHGNATTAVAGFMSALDKTKLDGIAAGAQVNTVTSVAGKTGAVTLAKSDVGLSNVTNDAQVKKTGDTMSGQLAVGVNSSTPAVQINQIGTGPALLIEDETSPDATPVVVTSDGEVLIGAANSLESLPGQVDKLQIVNTADGNKGVSVFGMADAAYPQIRQLKANSNLAAVTNNQILGANQWLGHTGTKFANAVLIRGVVDGDVTENVVPGQFQVLTTTTGALLPRLTVRADGKVGINTTSPSEMLEVAGTVKATGFVGDGSSLQNLNASSVTTGSLSTSVMGSGSASSNTFLRGDGTWATPVNTTYSLATSTVPGLIELGSDTQQTVAPNAVTATASRTYALQLNAAGQAVVNVPWTDNNTVYTHPTTDGNLHVPATGTTNGGKVLQAGSTAGSLSWKTLEMTDIPGAAFKKSVRVATTAALTVTATTTTLTNSGTLAALAIDGVTLAVNDRVLVKNQATAAQNGIYTVTNVGSASVAWVLTRAADADSSAEVSCAIVAVDAGATYGSDLWTNTFKTTDTLGTTAMNWYEVLYNSGTWAINTTGSAAKLTTPRALTIGSTAKNFDGSAAVSWSLAEIGAAASSHTHSYLPLTGGTLTGGLNITTAGNAAIELGRIDGTASTPFIDFHSGATATDYDARILASGGNGTAGQGTLTFNASAVVFPDNLKFRIGSSNDSEIYHNGTHTYIDHNITGDLYIRNQRTGGAIYLQADSTGGTLQNVLQAGVGTDNSCVLFADGATRLTTTTTGVTVSGNLDAINTFGTASYNLVASAPGTAQSQEAGVSFKPTFEGTADSGPRRAADIWAGYNGGAWGNEYLAFGVGVATSGSNDAQTVTTERMRLTKSGLNVTGTVTATGVVTATGGVNAGGMAYPIYEANIDFGVDAAGTWRKIVSASLVDSTYSTIAFKIDIVDPNSNHGVTSSVNPEIETYYVACIRSEATTLNTPDNCVVRGPSNRIRAIKTAVGAYEIQIQNETQYREYQIKITPYTWAGSASHSVSYFAGGTAGTATATYTASVGSSIDHFENIKVAGQITSNVVTATDFNSTSDERKKTDIQTASGSIVQRLRGVEFKWIENDQQSSGVIAQEVEAVIPHAVNTDVDGFKSVNYNSLVAYLIEGMKEQQKQIDELKLQVSKMRTVKY